MLKTIVILSLFSISVFADSWQPDGGLEQTPIWPKGAQILASGNEEELCVDGLQLAKILNQLGK